MSLNPSHTHFFLVDNGTRNTYNVGEFRAKLERKIALPRESSSGGGECSHKTENVGGFLSLSVVNQLIMPM